MNSTIVKAAGTIIVCIELASFLKPELLRASMRFFAKGKRLYVTALVRFALATLFFAGSKECDVSWVIVLFGVLFLVSGMLILILGLGRVRLMLAWYETQSVALLRVIALISLAVGMIIVCAA